MKRLLITLFTVLMLVSNLFASLSALENDMPDLTPGKKGTLTVETIDGTKPVEGFELTVYKVADIKVQPSGTVLYNLVAPFTSSGVSFDGMTVESSKTAASKLNSYTGSASGTTLSTDISGTAEFTDLEPGMYLVVNTKKRQRAAAYETLSPFLASVPRPMQDSKGNYWEYDVITAPKTTLHLIPDPIPDPPFYPPKTGIE